MTTLNMNCSRVSKYVVRRAHTGWPAQLCALVWTLAMNGVFDVIIAAVWFFGFANIAAAQLPFQCTANAGVPPLIRSQGVSEKAGDVVLNCAGGTATDAGVNVPTTDIQIFLNTSLTSRILDTATNSTEALLMIDEPAPADQMLCGSINGCNVQGKGGAAGTYVGQPNVFRGQLAGTNSIVFLGVPVDPPGTTQAARVIRITNIRANASALGIAGGNAPPTPLTEVISANGPTALPVNNPQQTVGFIQRGLTTSVTAGGPFQQCTSVTSGNGGSVTFTEGFATAFKVRSISSTGVPAVGSAAPAAQDVPGTIDESESQFYNPSFPAPYNLAGLSDFSTRLKIVFSGVPAGVTLSVPLAPTGAPNSPTLTLQLVTSETGPYAAATNGTVALDGNGNGVAVYEITSESPTINESVTIPITVSYTANAGANSPAIASAQATGSFAPTSIAADWTAASAGDPSPRFINDGTSASLFSVAACPAMIAVGPQVPAFNYVLGGNTPAAQNLSITSSSPAAGVSFTASLGSGCGWLSLKPVLGVTPANLSVSVNPLGLAPNNYTCPITITAPGISNSPQTVHATLTVTPSTTISANPPSLAFEYHLGTQAPVVQQIAVSSTNPSSGVSFTAALGTGCNWLAMYPMSGVTPGTLTAFVNTAGLVQGNYTCAITITAPNSANGAQVVHAGLTVLPSTTIAVSRPSISFAYRLGSGAPTTQTMVVSSDNPPGGVSFNVAPSADCGWVKLNATGGVTPAMITASVNTAGLKPTNYTCTLTFSAPDAINGPQTVEASLSVSDWPTIASSPNSLEFTSNGQPPRPQTVFIFAGASVGFSVTPSANWIGASFSSASTPAVLRVSVNPAEMAPGSYRGTIMIASPAANPASQTIPVTLNISSGQVAGGLTSQPENLAFFFVEGAQQAQTRLVTLAGTSAYHATSDSPWLTITPGDGTLNAATALSISADPAGLGPGTYTGSVSASSSQSGPIWSADVTMTISQSAQSITVSQTGLAFRVAANGTAPSQPLYIWNGGSGALSWSATSSTLSGGDWLSVSSPSGITGPSPTQVMVQVNSGGLAPGDYHGQVSVASTAPNSPQVVGVVMTVPAAGADIEPLVDPIGLIFTGSPGGPNPNVQTVSITNRGANAITFQSSTYFAGNQAWFTAQPASGTIGAGQTLQISIQPSLTGLAAGAAYTGELDFGFDDNSAQKINLLMVAPSGSSAGPTAQHSAASCAATSSFPMITSVGGESSLSIGRPAAVKVQMVDNCGGIPQGSGSMQLDFNNGDPTVAMTALPGGLWSATVTPRTVASGPFVITVQGQVGTMTTQPFALQSNLSPGAGEPVLAPHGVSSAASYGQAPMAPGSLINIYGTKLAAGSGEFSSFPLPREIAGAQVQLAGRPMPLISVSPERIIALVPYETSIDAMQQLVVVNGLSQSAPESLPVAPAQPAVFTVNQQGTGQAVATVGNTALIADAGHPVHSRDTIVIYSSGLGAVNPPVASGSAASATVLSQTETPVVTIGGKPAQVLFSGLTPGFAGLYQINAVVPEGVTPGNDVPVVINIAGQASPAVTIAVK